METQASPGGSRDLILAIESSCDETAAAVVERGRTTLSNIVASQIPIHARFGGVVPEIASREHLRHIVPVVRRSLQSAGIGFPDLAAVAVTEGPGLAGALLVGILYAKGLAFALDVPLIAVNHLEGHIHAVLMQAGSHLAEPVLALVVSGGHTHLYLAEQNAPGVWQYRNVGRTVDDAAGEAFDKTGKLLGLGYPAGPWMDRLATHGDAHAVPFHFGPIRTRQPGVRFDLSFSGIKTAVLRYVQAHPQMAEPIARRQRAVVGGATFEEVLNLTEPLALNLIASFQAAVVGVLLRQAFAAAGHFGARALLVSGGVAANRELRTRFTAQAAEHGLHVGFPATGMSTDNAAMIAAAAWPRLCTGQYAADDLTASPGLKLG